MKIYPALLCHFLKHDYRETRAFGGPVEGFEPSYMAEMIIGLRCQRCGHRKIKKLERWQPHITVVQKAYDWLTERKDTVDYLEDPLKH